MKRILVLFFISILFLTSYGDVINRIVARVDDEIITMYDLEENVQFFLAQSQDPNVDVNDLRKKILDSMIEDILVMKDAEKMKLMESIDEDLLNMNVDMAIDNIKAQYGSDEEFERALKMAGMTLGKLRENYSKQIKESEMTKIVIEKKVKSKINIERNEMEKYYNENKTRFVKAKGKVELAQIMIDGSRTGAMGIAENIRQRIIGGADFYELAKQESNDTFTKNDGGRLGELKTDELNKKITSEIVNLEEGNITNVIELGGNFFIFLVVKKHQQEPMSFEEAFDYVKADLYRQKIEGAFKEYIEELKKESFIEITL